MDEKLEDLKGRVKEAAGDLTDEERLEREGKLDRAGAAVKERIEAIAEKAKDVVDRVRDKASDIGDDESR